jgi:hypothetical protein
MSGLRTVVLLSVLLFSGFTQASYSFDNSPRASDEELDRMRGGFIVNLNGLEFLMAFSLERLTFINGELVSSVKLNPFALTSLAQLGQMAGLPTGSAGVVESPVTASDVPVQVAPPDTIVQPGGTENVSVATAVADSVTSEAAAASASATVPIDQSVSGAQTSASSVSTATLPTQSSSATGTATSSASTTVASPQVTTQGSLTVIQNGPGNTVALPTDISASALTTIIQNSLNDQVIRNVTIMNATFASKMLESQARLNAILDQGVRGLP